MSERASEFQPVPRDVLLARLRAEAQNIQSTIESESKSRGTHAIDRVMRVCSIAFQFGQLGELWDEFIPMETLKEIGHEAGQGVYPPVMKVILGERLVKEFSKSGGGSFPTESVKTIAAITSMLGDLYKKQTLEDRF